ncbi:MAG TPA: hypothetical protein VN604_08515, partial [Nitrospirota bacterium]|nr:hypothetical protein [Nitrospirota bacterium]
MHEPEQKKVRFVDEKEHTFKELSLIEEKTNRNINGTDGARIIRKIATISTNKKFVAFVKNRYAYAI